MTFLMRDRVRRFWFEEQGILIGGQHKVLGITMQNGEKYAIDMAGAQFGLTVAILPWDVYVALHVRGIPKIEDFVYTEP